MNTETDRDLTTEEQEQLSGGLFFPDDLPGEFATSSCKTPPPYYPGRCPARLRLSGGQKRPRNPHDVIG